MRRELNCKVPCKPFSGREVERACRGHKLGHTVDTSHFDLIDLEVLAAGQRAIDEAQGGDKRHFGKFRAGHEAGPYRGDLPLHAGGKFGPVTPGDHKLLTTRAEYATVSTDSDFGVHIPLGVDDVHASWAYDDMVDVRPGLGDPAVMQSDDGVVDLSKPITDATLTHGAGLPRAG